MLGYWENDVYLTTEDTAWLLFHQTYGSGFKASYRGHQPMSFGCPREEADLWFTLFDGITPHVFLCRAHTPGALMWLQLNAPG